MRVIGGGSEEKRTRTQGGALHHAVLGCPGPGAALERCSGYGFLLSLGASAELHLRQLDISNHIGVCEERNTP